MQALSVPAAALYTGLSKSTLDKYRVYGGGPQYIKLGSRVLYDLVDIDTWMAARKVANTSEVAVVAA